MGWHSCSDAIALQHWKSVPAPCSPLTFLVTYLRAWVWLDAFFNEVSDPCGTEVGEVRECCSEFVGFDVLLGLRVFGLRVCRMFSTYWIDK